MNKFDEMKSIGLNIETQTRTVIDKYIYVFGYKIDVEDLWCCLVNLKDDTSIYLSRRR